MSKDKEKDKEKHINHKDPLMKAIKAIHSIKGSSLTPEGLKRQRTSMELASKLAAPTDGIETESFNIGGIECERVRPEYALNPRYCILYAHGGGYICGGLGYARILAGKLAIATGFTVADFAYRLAPEHLFPAPIEDGMAMWDDLRGLGYDPSHILIAGDSAGGNLALCMAQKLIAERHETPAALLLFSPWTDMTATAASYETYRDVDPILSYQYVTEARNACLGEEFDPADPQCSPLYGSFDGFPPTLVQVGRNEILLDDSVSLAHNIRQANATVRLDIEDDGWHVYQQMPFPMATRAMKRLSRFVTDVIY